MASSCHLCGHQTSCVAAELKTEALDRLNQSLLRYNLQKKGRAVFNQGEPVKGFYILCSGMVKLVRLLENGDEVILDILGPCSVLEGYPNNQRTVHTYSVLTVTPSTEVAFLSSDKLSSLFKLDPALADALVRRLWTQLQRIYELLSLMKLRVRERLLYLLRDTVLACETADAAGQVIIPLSRTELAQLAQTTPETIYRTLCLLEREGIISVTKSANTAVQIDALNNSLKALE